MKRLLFLIQLFSVASIIADTTDPVAAFTNLAHFATGQVLYRWEADVNRDGKKEVFLDTAENYSNQEKHGRNIPGWLVYLRTADNSSYLLSKGVVPEDSPDVTPVLPCIDPGNMYIGIISQLEKSGIVTIQTDYAKNLPAVAYISAYTIEGDHLKETLLAQYDPTRGKNPIYEQYLSKEHRTKVRVEKITIN